jgi:hypothetical protein
VGRLPQANRLIDRRGSHQSSVRAVRYLPDIVLVPSECADGFPSADVPQTNLARRVRLVHRQPLVVRAEPNPEQVVQPRDEGPRFPGFHVPHHHVARVDDVGGCQPAVIRQGSRPETRPARSLVQRRHCSTGRSVPHPAVTVGHGQYAPPVGGEGEHIDPPVRFAQDHIRRLTVEPSNHQLALTTSEVVPPAVRGEHPF